jgi:chromosome segregation ATPase
VQEFDLNLPEQTFRNKVTETAKNTDAFTAKIKELETQCETLRQNTEKESRTAEKRAEQLRQKLKEQEAEIEDLNARLILASQPAAPVVDETLVRERDELLVKLGELCRERDELHISAADQDDTCKNLLQRVAELEQKIQADAQSADEAAQNVQQVLATSESVIQQLRNELQSWQQVCQKSTAAEQAALARVTETEADLADLLAMANARDTENAEKIAKLEKNATQSPEEIAQFYADQAAIYQMCKHELGVLSKSMEQERTYFEQLRHVSTQRMAAMQERKQMLMKQLGNSPADMTRLSVREQPSDPSVKRIRNEFDNLRFTHERDMRQAQERERELQRKLQLFETEAGRLRGLALEGEKLARRVQELSEQLRRSEHDLAEERDKYTAEREQFQGSQKALLTRIESLERGTRPDTPDSIQATDAKTVKLASWMRFKR